MNNDLIRELQINGDKAEALGKVIKIKDHLERLTQLERKAAISHLQTFAKNLPVFLCLNAQRTALVKVPQMFSGKKAVKLGFKKDHKGLPLKPKQIYEFWIPIETKPYELILNAFKRGGMEEVEKASIKYMEDFCTCQRILDLPPVVNLENDQIFSL